MITLVCVCIGAIITMIAAVVDYRNKLKEEKESLDNERKKSREYINIINKSNKIIESQRSVIDTTNKIIDLQNELNEKNQIIYDLQNKTFDNITGGKNVPSLYIIASDTEIACKVKNEGNLPIRNVSVTFNRVINDYMDNNGGSSTHPNVLKQYSKDFDDLQITGNKLFFEEKFEKKFDNIICYYEVKWENGYYIGGFKIKDGIITEQSITIFSDGFDLKKSVWINGKYSDVTKK